MSNSAGNVLIAVTYENGQLTVAQPTQVLAPTAGTFNVVWTLIGGTFDSANFFQWGSAIPPAPPVVQTTPATLDSTGTVITMTVDTSYINSPPFAWWYVLTAADGTTSSSSCLVLACAWAYPDQYSYFPGDTIQLHVVTNAPYVTLSLYPLSSWSQNNAGQESWTAAPLSTQVVSVPLSVTFAPLNKSQSGNIDWEWPPNVKLDTQKSWASGIYVAELAAFASGSAAAVTTTWVMFVLKNPSPQPGARMLYKWNINTIQAYSLAHYPYFPAPGLPSNPNDWYSYDNDLYGNPMPPPSSPPGTTAAQITFLRPTGQTWNIKSAIYDFPFIMWLAAQGIEVDYCTDVDVELDIDLSMLSNYPAVIFRGHDEYLGSSTYQNLTNYRNAGGNIAFFSGNTCCWRVWYGSYVNGLPTTFTCDKGPTDIHLDVNGPDAWWKQQPNDNALVGAGSRNAAITGAPGGPFYESTTPDLMESSGFTVRNAEHWIFAGSNVANGDIIGNQPPFAPANTVENLIGYESNGVALNSQLQPTFVDGTPANVVVLGVGVTGGIDGLQVAPSLTGTEASDWLAFSREGAVQNPSGPPTVLNPPYAATMGMYSSYGSVFSASTVNWVFILNEVNSNGGYYNFPPGWPPSGYLGNPALHQISLNVLTAFANPNRTLGGAADLNGDGQPDLVFQSAGTGEVSYWLMNGTARTTSGSVLYDGTASPGQSLRVAAAGSLSASGGGIFLQEDSNGSVYYWATTFASGAVSRASAQQLVPGDSPGSQWKLCTVMGSGTPGTLYLLFQHQQNGSLWYWEMQGTTRITTAALVPAWQPGNVQWVLAGALDLNGDGVTDLVFQNPSTGAVQYWVMSGINKTTEGSIGGISSSPGTLAAAANLGSAAQPCLIFQNGTGGALTYVAISDFAAGSAAPFTPTSNPSFLGPAPA
ncbi:MAG: hypothetical protein QOK37_4513 [Thermoanaerobaculia bacterium]|jgi:hypothetical protein|nr:hypothetical protein [Thermoanaerobaculia bacterium]